MPAESPQTDPRLADVVGKHQRVAELLADEKADALLLTRADSFAWMTSGGRGFVSTATDTAVASLWITQDERVVLTTNIEAKRLLREEIRGLDFEVRASPWHADPAAAIATLTERRQVICDAGVPNARNVFTELQRLRMTLTDYEHLRYQELGRDVSEAMERTAKRLKPGATEWQVAGGIAHRFWQSGIEPVVLLVAFDKRIARYRHPLPTKRKLDKLAMLVAVGRRGGLHVSITRLAHIGPAPETLKQKHAACAMVDAAFIFFSRPGEACSEVFRRGRRMYEKAGYPDEWQEHHQGGITGYAPREVKVTPDSPVTLRSGMALAWNPSIAGTKSEDTIFIDHDGFELLTRTIQWPTLKVDVKGYIVRRPDILEL